MSVAEFVDFYIRYAIIPAWLLAGMADWACHRRTHIEANSGTKESALHLAQMLEVGVPLLVALVFQINALVICMMSVGLILHELTAFWDVRYARELRDITAVEQHIHSFLELLPIGAVTLVIGAHLAKVQSFLAEGTGGDFALSPSPVPPPYIAAVLAAAILFAAIPYAEELVRCIRHRRRALRCASHAPSE